MLHALIVDDDVDALAGLEELVVREGFTTATAVNLKQARERMALQHSAHGRFVWHGRC